MKSFCVTGMEDWAVLNEGCEEMAEMFEPWVGEGSRGV